VDTFSKLQARLPCNEQKIIGRQQSLLLFSYVFHSTTNVSGFQRTTREILWATWGAPARLWYHTPRIWHHYTSRVQNEM